MQFKNLMAMLALALFASFGMVACNQDDDETPVEEQTIAEYAAGNPNFSTLVSALNRTGLTATLNGSGTFTVFAPTNAAFTALGVDLATISDAALTQILLYHVLGGEITAANIPDGQSYVNSASETGPNNAALSLLIEKTGNAVKINNSINVTTADVRTKNGVIHVVDKVIMPLDIVGHAAANSNFTSLVGALGAASGGLVNVLQGAGPFTVFAPVNAAFDEIASVTATLNADQLASVLTYHVVPGLNVRSTALTNGQLVPTVNGETFQVNLGTPVTITDASGNTSTVLLTDVQATNGVIHVIRKVLIPVNL